MKNGVEQDIENIESFYDVEKNIYNIAKIQRKIVICRKDGIYV